MIRIVIDTNLFIAAYRNRNSASARILRILESGRAVGVCFTTAIERELFRILKRGRTSTQYRDRIRTLLESGERIHDAPRVHLVKEDPSDNKFLGCATKAGASYILTNDRHLLDLGTVEGIRITRPQLFLTEWSEKKKK